jgi:hypothetical protein
MAKCPFLSINFVFEDSEQVGKANLPRFIGRVYHCFALGRGGREQAGEKLTIF